jgi:CheY-like chemotaxis protein
VTADVPTELLVLSERINVADFESDHFRAHLVQRLAWAVDDAHATEHDHPDQAPSGRVGGRRPRRAAMSPTGAGFLPPTLPSKGLTEAMGGTIEVTSTVGTGTTFVIELAAAERPSPARQPSRSGRELAEPDDHSATRRRILYIEDNLSNLTLVERILQRRGNVELIPAMQGTIGLELARQHRPDLIVLDLHLPDTPRAEVLTRLETEPRAREISP